MAARKPLVLVSGKIQQLSSSDTLDATVNETEGVSLTNGESGAITKGLAVYLETADTTKKALADAIGTAEVFGLVADDSIAAGSSGVVKTAGQLVNTDWSAVMGTTHLTAGAIYYLSNAASGSITATPPTTGFITEIGRAINTTTMQIAIRVSIKL